MSRGFGGPCCGGVGERERVIVRSSTVRAVVLLSVCAVLVCVSAAAASGSRFARARCSGGAAPQAVRLGAGVTINTPRGWRVLARQHATVEIGCSSPYAVFYAVFAPAPSSNLRADLAADVAAVRGQYSALRTAPPTQSRLPAGPFDSTIVQAFQGVIPRNRPTPNVTGEFFVLVNSATGKQLFAVAYSDSGAHFRASFADIGSIFARL